MTHRQGNSNFILKLKESEGGLPSFSPRANDLQASRPKQEPVDLDRALRLRLNAANRQKSTTYHQVHASVDAAHTGCGLSDQQLLASNQFDSHLHSKYGSPHGHDGVPLAQSMPPP